MAALLQPVTHQHRRNRKKTKGCQRIHYVTAQFPANSPPAAKHKPLLSLVRPPR